MQYQQNNLDKLWNIIRNELCKTPGTYFGLREVTFDIGIERYRIGYQNYVNDNHTVAEFKITTDLEGVIRELSGNPIKFHHLSCIADDLSGDEGYLGGNNSALCIHYREGGVIKSVIFPGVNYIFDEQTKKEHEKLSNVFSRIGHSHFREVL